MHPITQKIAALQRRLAFHKYATALCWTAATLLVVAIALGIVDYLVRYRDPGLRILASAALAAAAVWALYRWWRPGTAKLSPLNVARHVESHFPQLNDSLASAVEFLHQSEDDQTAGSPQLRRLVVAKAETAIEGLPLDDVVDRRPLRRAATWLAVAAAILVVSVAWNAGAVRTALARLVAPLGSTDWPRDHHLAFRDPPSRLAAGQTFEAELIDTAGDLPDEVRIIYRIAQGPRRETTSEPMTRIGDSMLARRENVRESFAFRAVGGDDDSMRWHFVEVVEAPQLKQLTITVHPPAYTGMHAVSAQRHLEVLEGTGIELRGIATEPISAARILQDGLPPIDGTIHRKTHEPEVFSISPDKWVATDSTRYQLELSGVDGLASVVGEWNLRVEPDSPPTIAWQSPVEDIYVTPGALIPVALVVKDNLAIRNVELLYDRSDWSEAEREREAPRARITLYEGPETPVVHTTDSVASIPRGETRVIEHPWDLTHLSLPVGAEISIFAEATDYRPGTAKTDVARRITIITREELETRLAERLAQIVRQLERALTAQRGTREDVRRLEISLREAGELTAAERNSLQSAELNQRRIGRMLTDPAEGLPELIKAMAGELEMNRIAEFDSRTAIDRLTSELDRLAAGPLGTAERQLSASHKTLNEVEPATTANSNEPLALTPEQSAAISESLTDAGVAQDDVIAVLERLVSELSGRADYRRFARLVAELRQDQLAHQQTSRAEIGVETIPLRLSDLNRAQRATLEKASAAQVALRARYDKILQGMDELSRTLAAEQAEGADTLAEAVELARTLAIAAKMAETGRDLAENRIGSALQRETQIAADLQQVLDALRGVAEKQPEQIVDQLKQAEEQLEELRQELAALQEQIAAAEAQPAANQQQLDRLRAEQNKLQAATEQLSRQLGRLEAAAASQSTQSAANRLKNQNDNTTQPPGQQQRPASSSEVQKAEEDLAAAAEQLAQHRQQAEDDLALEIVRRFQTQLADMVERQKIVVQQTVALQEARPPNEPLTPSQLEQTAKLAAEERVLADMALEHSELLHGLGAVRVSLEDAQRRLLATAGMLDERDTGTRTQAAARRALARLEGMLNAFAQTANEAAQQNDQQPPAAAGANQNAQQPQRRPTFELLEVKMLRMLQADLQTRTREYQERLTQISNEADENMHSELQKEANELATEQGRLAELVEVMLTRDNENTQ